MILTLPFVYELLDTVTGKWYVGCRTAKGCHPSDLGVRYFTSSRLVSSIYKANPSRFISKILVSSTDSEYVVKVESDILTFRKAKDSSCSYNMWNGDGKFNASKAAQSTVELKVGVHNRTEEQRFLDAQKGGRLGGKVTRAKKVGIFDRSLEQMQAAGRHVGKTQSLEQKIANGIKSGNKAKELGLGFCGMSKEQRIANGKKASIRNQKCAECGLLCSGGNLYQHQRATGHKGKIKL